MELGSSCLRLATGTEFEGIVDRVVCLPSVVSAVGIDILVGVVGVFAASSIVASVADLQYLTECGRSFGTVEDDLLEGIVVVASSE